MWRLLIFALSGCGPVPTEPEMLMGGAGNPLCILGCNTVVHLTGGSGDVGSAGSLSVASDIGGS